MPFAALGLAPARVAVEHRSQYELYSAQGPLAAVLAGKLRYTAGDKLGLPAAGDWVAAAPRPEGEATIHGVVTRRSAFTRQAAGREKGPQVVAANSDVAFAVTSCTAEFNPRRLERYLAAAWDSGATPVVVLSKADLATAPESFADAARQVAGAVPVILTSAATGLGLDQLAAALRDHKTGALLGSSGVGKSTIINRLLGEERLRAGGVRAKDGKGRHTTTHRELIELPGGGLVLDTPGMRQLAVFAAEKEDLLAAFADVRALAEECAFADCRHEAEPGCAVQAAIAEGALAADRLEAFRKLAHEHGLRRPDWEKRAEEIRISKERSRLRKRGPR